MIRALPWGRSVANSPDQKRMAQWEFFPDAEHHHSEYSSHFYQGRYIGKQCHIITVPWQTTADTNKSVII